mmetsp:Transcript_2638/g.7851  ORF Transcript_2638/g.7851 Transcript_2638/m.7851 type:complete len:242 (+) Transcript_2638:2658-3383(+)
MSSSSSTSASRTTGNSASNAALPSTVTVVPSGMVTAPPTTVPPTSTSKVWSRFTPACSSSCRARASSDVAPSTTPSETSSANRSMRRRARWPTPAATPIWSSRDLDTYVSCSPSGRRSHRVPRSIRCSCRESITSTMQLALRVVRSRLMSWPRNVHRGAVPNTSGALPVADSTKVWFRKKEDSGSAVSALEPPLSDVGESSMSIWPTSSSAMARKMAGEFWTALARTETKPTTMATVHTPT